MALNGRFNAIIAVNSIFPFCAIFAVVLRFYARKLKASAFMIDDYVIVSASIFMMGNSMPFIYGAVKGGLGQHVESLTPDEITVFGKVTFWTQFPYIWAVSCVKLSILLLYRRIFTTPKFRITVSIIGVIIILWTIAFFFASLFQALPISYNWDPYQPGTTIDEVTMYLALASTELVLDVIVLSLPSTVIWKLQMSRTRKWIVTGIFMLGCFVCISGALRVYYFVGVRYSVDSDFTYDTYDVFIWTAIEPCVGVICACLPNLGPIFQKGHAPDSMLSSFRNYIRLRTGTSPSKNNASTDWSNGSAEVVSSKSLFQMPQDATILTSINSRPLTDVERDRISPENIMVNMTISTSQGKGQH